MRHLQNTKQETGEGGATGGEGEGPAVPRMRGTPTSRIRSLGGSDEEEQGRAGLALARQRFGSTFVAKQRWKKLNIRLNTTKEQHNLWHSEQEAYTHSVSSPSPMFDLTGKVALVTGAQRGMGRADALALAAQGATVIVTDIDLKTCESVVKEIEKVGGTAAAFALNVTEKKQIDAVFDAVIKQFKRIDILVNNAGIFRPKPALEMTEEEWQQTIDVNLKGYFLCAQRAAKEMAKQKYGRIINIASIACGQVGAGFMGAAHYSATKGGVIGMTETMALEWAPLGITVNAIGPGAIDTPMVAMIKDDPASMKAITDRVPMKRMGQPEEIAAAVAFLASDEASYVTGATLFVDGGYLAA